ncbi:TrbC/VirB2 family protein [Dyella nitratireducens]|uniref:Type IV secretion system protein VirB2 n=1 Tax=Dyella nitratireducens TaxID=1849580 RepID=A0ABQ1FMW0_9GAMM|nr:TrbC/VirB2 family protein [Dyella nitratireducens]GGA22113.1 hypothetical protein GCM10010981_07870 [Dyella nitratireducens]GLQ44153.1 hypothetical protein GCM10007902_40030 [Dyella nitratireducens]
MISRNRLSRIHSLTLLVLAASLVLPSMGFAQDASELTQTTCGFFSNINTVLNAISIVVVTIAVMFSGYKVAFSHARIAEVTPVLIGAILIGAASQIAKLFLSGSAGSSQCQATTGLIPHGFDHVAAVVYAVLPLV